VHPAHENLFYDHLSRYVQQARAERTVKLGDYVAGNARVQELLKLLPPNAPEAKAVAALLETQVRMDDAPGAMANLIAQVTNAVAGRTELVRSQLLARVEEILAGLRAGEMAPAAVKEALAGVLSAAQRHAKQTGDTTVLDEITQRIATAQQAAGAYTTVRVRTPQGVVTQVVRVSELPRVLADQAAVRREAIQAIRDAAQRSVKRDPRTGRLTLIDAPLPKEVAALAHAAGISQQEAMQIYAATRAEMGAALSEQERDRRMRDLQIALASEQLGEQRRNAALKSRALRVLEGVYGKPEAWAKLSSADKAAVFAFFPDAATRLEQGGAGLTAGEIAALRRLQAEAYFASRDERFERAASQISQKRRIVDVANMNAARKELAAIMGMKDPAARAAAFNSWVNRRGPLFGPDVVALIRDQFAPVSVTNEGIVRGSLTPAALRVIVGPYAGMAREPTVRRAVADALRAYISGHLRLYQLLPEASALYPDRVYATDAKTFLNYAREQIRGLLQRAGTPIPPEVEPALLGDLGYMETPQGPALAPGSILWEWWRTLRQ
jgi:hypothetical protein